MKALGAVIGVIGLGLVAWITWAKEGVFSCAEVVVCATLREQLPANPAPTFGWIGWSMLGAGFLFCVISGIMWGLASRRSKSGSN